MDEKLQQIFKIRPLQIDCIAYRSSTDEYRKMVKSAYISELKNLFDVEMVIEKVNLKIPDENHIPTVTGAVRTSKVDCLLNELGIVEESEKLLKSH